MLPIMKPFIGGEYIDSKATAFFTIHDPSTGEPIARVPQCTKEEMNAAIAAAKAAFPAWKDTPVKKRAAIMRIGVILRSPDDVADSLVRERLRLGHDALMAAARRLLVELGARHLDNLHIALPGLA